MAEFNLGLCYAYGEGVGKNLEKAFFWYQKAADQGLAAAQYALGSCYTNGHETRKDLDKAWNGIKKLLTKD